MIGQAIVSIIDGISPLIFIIIPKFIIDEIINGNNFNKVIIYVCIYVILQLTLSIVSAFITEKYINLNGHLYAMHFLLLINKKIVSLDMAQLDLPDTHQQIALAQDIVYKGIGVNIINGFFSFITSIIIIISTSIIVITADVYFLIIIIIFSLISVSLNLKNENWKITQRDENIYLTRVLNYYISIMGSNTHSKEMRIFGFSDWLMEKYYNTLKQLKMRLKKLYSKSLQLKVISIFLESIKSNGIYLLLAFKTFTGKISIGEFTQFFSATSQLSSGILDFVSFFTQLSINSKYIESFRSFMKLESNIEREKVITKKIKSNDINIKLTNVSFTYPNSNANVLNNISYEFKSGKVYVIVGENGAGKSTLINLLVRLYEPTAGTILLNDIPINEINYKEYRDNFSIVFQDFKYFSFTVAENIALNQYEKDNKEIDKKIIKSLKNADILDKINTLPNGINTNLDKIFYDDGVILSGGENQKLALARALFRNTKILILDEPSSALDPLSEDELLNSFKKIASDKIVIYISHRLSCAKMADEIIFIKNNKIHERGSHEELISKNSDYAKYYNSQAKHYN